MYEAKCKVSGSTFDVFCQIVRGFEVPLNSENCAELQVLCEEFRFDSLSKKIAEFQATLQPKEDIQIEEIPKIEESEKEKVEINDDFIEEKEEKPQIEDDFVEDTEESINLVNDKKEETNPITFVKTEEEEANKSSESLPNIEPKEGAKDPLSLEEQRITETETNSGPKESISEETPKEESSEANSERKESISETNSKEEITETPPKEEETPETDQKEDETPKTPPEEGSTEKEEGLQVKDQIPVLILSRPIRPRFSEEVLNATLESLISEHNIPKAVARVDPEMRRPLCQHIARCRLEALKVEDYQRCQILVNILELLRKAITKDLLTPDPSTVPTPISERLKEAKSLLKEMEQEYKKTVKDIKFVEDQRKKDIERRQAFEREKFAKKWEDPSQLHTFNKPSAALLELREVQKKMALQNDFANAKIMKKRVQTLEKYETEDAENKAKEVMRLKFQAMMHRHSLEMAGHQGRTNRILREAEIDNEASVTPVVMAIRKLSTATPLKVKRPPVSKSVVVTQRFGSGCGVDDRPAFTTSRTMRELTVVKGTVKSEGLPVRGVATQRYMRSQLPKKKRVKKEKKLDF
jgi:hypothetical protein